MKQSYHKILIILLGGLFLYPFLTSAALTCPSDPCPSGGICIKNPLCADSFTELINNIINFLFYIALAVAPIMIIVSGFYFITAMGEPEKIKTAKTIILWTLIGLLVIICAKGIVKLFQDVFLGQDGGTPLPRYSCSGLCKDMIGYQRGECRKREEGCRSEWFTYPAGDQFCSAKKDLICCCRP